MPHPYQVRHLFYSLWLFRVLGGAAFADHADLDLAGVIQLVLDLFGNLAGQQDDLIITNLIRLNQVINQYIDSATLEKLSSEYLSH